MVGLAVGAAIVGAAWIALQQPAEPQAVRRFRIAEELKPRMPAISPDGRTIAFQLSPRLFVDFLQVSATVDLRYVFGDAANVSDLFLVRFIDDFANMGFTRDQVRGVIRELSDSGQTVDTNVVLDRLMNSRR